MFSRLGDKIRLTIGQLGKQARLTEENTTRALAEVRVALLEADTAVSVVEELTTRLKKQALGTKVQQSLNPGQTFIKIVHQEIVRLLGPEQPSLNLRTRPPAVIMVVGLQGSGKTTNLAKIALWLHKKNRKKVLLCSLDLSRPAAIEQLNSLANQAQIDFYHEKQSVFQLAKSALEQATLGGYDCLLIDSAGRTQIDSSLMMEINRIHEILNPIETLYVLDAMGGQDAVQVAKGFEEHIPITGIMVTKLDSSARGGAILSIHQLLNKPIKLMGNGEKIIDIIDFNPTMIADRILGMGDILAVIRQAEMTLEPDDSSKLTKINKKRFNFNDLRQQLTQLQKMGGLSSMMAKMGINQQMAAQAQQKLGDKQTKKFIALIDSMTPMERKNPQLLNGSRKMRIIKGAGSSMAECNQMLKRLKELHKMKKLSNKASQQQALKQKFQHILANQSPIIR